MKLKTLILAAIAATLGSASATVTLTFNKGGFLGETGQTTGITWGIVVDAAGDGLDGLTPPGYRAGFTLANNTILTGSNDDFLFLSAGTTVGAGGGGFLTQVAGVTDAEGRAFGIIWFDSTVQAGETAGQLDTYGFYTQANFIIPAPGASVTIPGITNTPTNALLPFGVIPEPSAAILGAVGLLGLLRRRR